MFSYCVNYFIIYVLNVSKIIYTIKRLRGCMITTSVHISFSNLNRTFIRTVSVKDLVICLVTIAGTTQEIKTLRNVRALSLYNPCSSKYIVLVKTF